MYQEVKQAKEKMDYTFEIIGPENLSKWDYIVPGDHEYTSPKGQEFYRFWTGTKGEFNSIKKRDFSKNRGSGTSAVLHAAEQGFGNILIIGFDILGAKQWEKKNNEVSHEQNNVYKNTRNYPDRDSMKGYLKYEWLYHLTQIFRYFPLINFYFFSRKEYIYKNPFICTYFNFAPKNLKVGSYADFHRYVNDEKENIVWTKLNF